MFAALEEPVGFFKALPPVSAAIAPAVMSVAKNAIFAPVVTARRNRRLCFNKSMTAAGDVGASWAASARSLFKLGCELPPGLGSVGASTLGE